MASKTLEELLEEGLARLSVSLVTSTRGVDPLASFKGAPADAPEDVRVRVPTLTSAVA